VSQGSQKGNLEKKINRVKTQPTEFLPGFSTNRRLTSRIYKELKKLTTKWTNMPINKWANEVSRPFSYEVRMANNFVKRRSTCSAPGEMQIKTTLRPDPGCQACNARYVGGKDQEDHSLRPSWAKKVKIPCQPMAERCGVCLSPQLHTEAQARGSQPRHKARP
jgi:hypothetical protein